jgi:protocatechuate 3,4-dioxygenase beta subunit
MIKPMTRILKAALVFLFIGLLVISCKKDVNTNDGGNNNVTELSDITTKVSASANGYVFDETGEPVLNAQVHYGNKFGVTDMEGHFEIKNAQVIKNAAVLKVEVEGYFTAVKTAITSEGRSTFFKVTLLSKEIIGSVNASSGGAVSSSGMQIQLPSNAVKNTSNNSVYNGSVSVAATYIDPTADNLNEIMPGDLRGISAGGEMNGLTTFGMIGVEMTGSSGESLQIADGKTATVTIPIPASMVANAPASIPLWHFNETKGLWEEQGSANKIGSAYVGQVSHFSYWNCDLPNAIVPLTFTIKDPAGNPINGAHVEIVPTSPNSWSHIGGYTDSTGYVSVYVTPNTSYEIRVYPNCWNYGGTPSFIYPFAVQTTAVALGDLTVNNNQMMVTVSGRVVDCSNNPVSNGYVFVRNNYIVTRYPLNSTGGYTFTTILCSDTSVLQITGQDLVAGNLSTAYSAVINPGSVTIPDLQACGVVSEKFINYTLNGATYSFISPIDSIYTSINTQTNPATIWVAAFGQAGYCNFSFTQTGIGLGSTQTLIGFYSSQVNDSSSVVGTIPVNITQFGNTGEFFTGNFTGTLSGMTGNRQIQANFRASREW